MASLLSLPPELAGIIYSSLSLDSQHAFASSCHYIRSAVVPLWSRLSVEFDDGADIPTDNNPLLSVPAGMALRRICISAYLSGEDYAPDLLSLFLPGDEASAQKVRFNLRHVEEISCSCHIRSNTRTLGRFLGSLPSLRCLTLHKLPDPAFFKGLAEGGSKLSTLSVRNKELSASASKGIASLGTLRCLDIYAAVCKVAPLSSGSLKELRELKIFPLWEDGDNSGVRVRGLTECIAGMQALSILRLPHAPSGALLDVLPSTLETICLGSTSISDVVRIASHAGLPALCVEVSDLHFSGIQDMSDAYRAGAVLSQWQHGTRHERVKFEFAREVSCLDAFLHICACIPNYRYCLSTLFTTDITSSSWGQLARSGAHIEAIVLECEVKYLSNLHGALDALDSVDVQFISVDLRSYQAGCVSQVLAFSAGCALRSRNKGQHLYICGAELLNEVNDDNDESLVEELYAIGYAWELLSADLKGLHMYNGPRSITIVMDS